MKCSRIIDFIRISYTVKCNGKNGRLFTSKKDPSKFIFIPAAGVVLSDTIYSSGELASIWSSMLSHFSKENGQELRFDEDLIDVSVFLRCDGLNVRGVIG